MAVKPIAPFQEDLRRDSLQDKMQDGQLNMETQKTWSSSHPLNQGEASVISKLPGVVNHNLNEVSPISAQSWVHKSSSTT